MKTPVRMLIAAVLAFTAVPAQAIDAIGKVYTLQDAYLSALGTNEVVKIAEENLFQSESRVDQAWTYLYPRLVGQSAYTRYSEVLPPGGGAFIFQPLNQFQAALILTQPLYTGGRTLAALQTAQTLRDVSTNGLTATKQNILLNAAQAYYGVIKAQKLVDVSRRSLERMEWHKIVTEREATTRRTKANVSALLRATTLVSQARINLVRAEDGLKINREQLSLVTKLPADAVILEPESLDSPHATFEQLKETALASRADYAGSQLNRKVAEENVTIVKGAHYPQLFAEGGVQYQDSSPKTALDGTVYYGGLRLQIPIFEGGLMKAETSEARSKVRQAELSTALLQRSIETEVHEAYINLQTITSVLATAKLQLEYAKDNFDAVEVLYSEGLLSSLSMIDAEQALSQAEQELVNATYDRQVAILRLRKSIGLLGKNGDIDIMIGDNHASS